MTRLDPLAWLRARDPGFLALRRAARAAVVMPSMFAIGDKVIANPTIATFAAFGSFAMVLLVEFGGRMRDRLQAQVALAVAGAALISLGTLASRSPWLAAPAMAIVAFGVIFAGVVSSVLASATVALLLLFILPVSLVGPISSIPDRLAGFGFAAAASLLAISLLWPAPTREPLRGAAVAACRAIAARLRSDVAFMLGEAGAPTPAEHEAAIAQADEALASLHRVFFATPYRPTRLATAARTLVRLVDELNWLNGILVHSQQTAAASPVNRAACAVKSAAASVLAEGADLLETPATPSDELLVAVAELHEALADVERTTTVAPSMADEPTAELVSSLDPSFRAQELSFAVSQIAANIDLTAAAERRSWFDAVLGRQPAGVVGPLAAAHQRAAAHVERHSVWLHNSIRGAIGLGVAVFVANESGVQHAFWVVLGTLSVLRSNALNTGQNIVRGLLGTVVGFIVGAALIELVGTNTTVLWVLLPVAILFAGFAPAAISFAAGQAAFTLTLEILFNIIQPVGWRVGLVRIEDVALGCAVSLFVGVLFWPRGAASALGRALAEAYADSARYLAGAVSFGMSLCDSGGEPRPAPTDEATRAAAAARRLDDAFRSYLAEHGAKPVPLAGVTGLLTGVVGLRLAADAVLDLWDDDDGSSGGDRAAARSELLARAETIAGWYERFASALLARNQVPEALARDTLADDRLIGAVRRDLQEKDGSAGDVAVRMIWTGDHLDAARRLQATLIDPARAVAG